MKVNSVCGPVERSELGIITPHEHIIINLSAFFEERPLKDIKNPADFLCGGK